MLQRRSSSAESAHASTEARVSGHSLEFSGRIMKWVSKKMEVFVVKKRMGLRIFLRNWNDFAAKTKFGIVLENFCRIEVGLRVFLSEEKREVWT